MNIKNNMKTYYKLSHHFKNSLLEIKAEKEDILSWEELDYRNKKKCLESVTFKVISGKKSYDIIRQHGSIGEFFSQRIIDVFSKFIDMSDKCYPIKIKGVDMTYYAIFDLSEVPYVNRKENKYIEEPTFIDAHDMIDQLFVINDTLHFIITEEIKDALFDNKITNISLEECFSCSRDGYERIKKTGIWPEVHSFADRQNNRITTEYYRL